MNVKILSKISMVINKMEISSMINDIDFTKEISNDELGKMLVKAILDNFYKAENEFIDLIALVKGISKEEAENVDVIQFVMDLLKDEKIKSFLQLM